MSHFRQQLLIYLLVITQIFSNTCGSYAFADDEDDTDEIEQAQDIGNVSQKDDLGESEPEQISKDIPTVQVLEFSEDPNEDRNGVWKNGQFYCLEGCGPNFDPRGNGWGDGTTITLPPGSYTGQTVDEAFGRSDMTESNPARLRWTDIDYGYLDYELANTKDESEQTKKLAQQQRATALKFANIEAADLADSVLKTVRDSTPSKTGYICKDENCSGELAAAKSMDVTSSMSPLPSSDAFISNLMSTLPGGSDEMSAVESSIAVGNYIDNAPYTSDHKDQFDSIRDRLNSSQTQGPQQRDAKEVAYRDLRMADNAYAAHDLISADIFFKYAKILADIATDIVPFTSIPKDSFRAIVGKDTLTGKALDKQERIIAGGFAILNIATLGMSSFISSIKEIGIISEVSGREIDEAEKIVRAARSEEITYSSSPVGRRNNPIEVMPGTNLSEIIGGRKYTGHALDRMQGRGITPSVVEHCIQVGEKTPGKFTGTSVFTSSDIRVVINENGLVITVIPK